MTVTIIGAGLAGCEAAWQLIKRNIPVHLVEMRPLKTTPAHTTDLFAELVCSNSLRSDEWQTSAVGLLHKELRQCDSLIMQAADKAQVPAGGALAVNRTLFSEYITKTLKEHPLVTVETKEGVIDFDSTQQTIVATGPLSSDKMISSLQHILGEDFLHFFDAIAPIVYTETVDMNAAWYQSRYDKGEGTDYLNCPLTKEEYNIFLEALLNGETKDFKDWEKNTPYFEGCLPIEVMAKRGTRTLLFGPMKPVGLFSPFENRRPFAVVQLRKENKAGTLMNMVGFQTKLTYKAQKEVFSLIPALKNAEFARLGGIHRNTFVCGPVVLNERLSLKKAPHIKLAGQITGCEGYVESTAIGLLAGLFCAKPEITLPPPETALGAMLRHITVNANAKTFQPMNINFGLFPEPEFKLTGVERRKMYSSNALMSIDNWLKNINN